MKTRILFFTMIAAALSFSCQKAELENNGAADGGTNNEIVDFVPGPGKILAVSPTGTETKIAFGEEVDGKYPVVWTNNDAIKVYSENNTEGVVYTYTTEATEGVSSAVFTGDPVEGETRYAVFPATRAYGFEDGKLKISFDALKKQDYHTSIQANGSNLKYMPMWATEGEGDDAGKFSFENLCGVVSFRFNDYQELRGMKITSVKIASASKYISGVATLDPATGSFTLAAENTENPESDKAIVVNRANGLAIGNTNTTPSISDAGEKGFLIALPIGEYPAGDLTVTITDSFGRVFTRTVNSPLTVLPGVDKTFKTLSFTFAYGESNSVVVSPGQTVTFDAAIRYSFAHDLLVENMTKVTKADGTDFVEEGLNVAALWEIPEGGTKLTAGSVLETVALSGNMISVTAKADVKGNALVVLKDKNDVILWSWHIWVVDGLANLTFTDCTGSPTIQNMNLGATQNTLYMDGTSQTNQDAIGLFYQYGRKDPFVMPKSLTRKTSSPFLTGKDLTRRVERDEETKANARVDWTIKNPDARILRSLSTQTVRSAVGFSNWTYAAADLKTYWHSTEKTIYDPCPKGYKVPDYSVFAEFDSDKAPAVHVVNTGYLFGTSSSVTPSASSYDPSTMAYFPNCGFLLQGTMEGKTHTYATNHMYTYRAFNWTTTPTESHIRVFPGGATGCHLDSSGNPFQASMGSANNIRCMKIQ